jgi:hypothetical protein
VKRGRQGGSRGQGANDMTVAVGQYRMDGREHRGNCLHKWKVIGRENKENIIPMKVFYFINEISKKKTLVVES